MTSPANQDKQVKHVVQLGFSVEYEDDEHRLLTGHHLPMWRGWDGGQLGGRPTWLNPKDIPQNYLTCKCCHNPLVFICQFYCPCDEINPNAFHRTFYMFACPNSNNKNGCGQETTGTIRVLRTQLPEQNPYFPIEQNELSAMHLPEYWEVNLCRVCGQRGRGKCPVQGYHFCGRHHQKEHMKYIFNKQESSSDLEFSFMPSVLTASELVVEEEPLDEKDEQSRENAKPLTMFQALNDDTGDDNENDDEEELDRNLEQGDLNEMTGAGPETVSKDAFTMQFYDRINKMPNVNTQCLRYLRWPDQELCFATTSPLWMRSDYRPNDDDIPSCERCGATRRYEFQLMPQMLHYLLRIHNEKEKNKEDDKNTIKKEEIEALRAATNIMEQSPPEQVPPDLVTATEKAVNAMRAKIMEGDDKVPNWGCVSVFTCTGSCGGIEVPENSELGAYIEEFSWKQPSLD